MSSTQSTSTAVVSTNLPLSKVRQGKVRDVYEVDAERLLMVATDRMSAFDVVFGEPIPFKGQVLNLMSAFWFARTSHIVPNHMISVDPKVIAQEIPQLRGIESQWAGRAMLVRKAPTIPIECVVRGYITGSAWKEYKASGTLAGEPLPAGMLESQAFQVSIFSPATKAEEGLHDENITFEEMCNRIDPGLALDLRRYSHLLYEFGHGTAASSAGIILADTKFEFGTLPDGTVILIDEVLTPDSSRFWPTETYAVGKSQTSLDKQPIRDFGESIGWNKKPPAPALSPEAIRATSDRYLEAFRRITGFELEEFPMSKPEATPYQEA